MTRPARLAVLRAAIEMGTHRSDLLRRQSGERIARRWDVAVDKALQSIFSFPLLSHVVFVDPGSGIEVRRRAIRGFDNFALFYHVEPDSVVVIHLLHGSMQVERALGQVPFQEDEE